MKLLRALPLCTALWSLLSLGPDFRAEAAVMTLPAAPHLRRPASHAPAPADASAGSAIGQPASMRLPQPHGAQPAGGALARNMAGTPPLPLPAVPATLRTPHARAAYLLEHFWDAMDFGDTLRSRDERFVEQSLVDFLSLFPHADTAALAPAVQRLVRRAGADAEACLLVLRLAEKYLYTPGSPMRCEEYFIPFLEAWVRTPGIDDAEKIRPALLLEAALKNRPGSTAADLRFRTHGGAQGTLHGIGCERLLLLFYNPDCTHCTETIRLLDGNEAFRAAVRSGRLGVAALCAGEERAAWERTKEELPKGWIAGYAAEELAETEAYVLPEMPTIYLLDRDKRVLLKEATPHDVLRRVESEASGR